MSEQGFYPSQRIRKGITDRITYGRPHQSARGWWKANRHYQDISDLLDLIERDGFITGRKVG